MPGRFALVVSLVALVTAIGLQPGGAQGVGEGPQFVPSEVIVKFRFGASAADRSRALGRANARAVERLTRTAAAAATGHVELARVGGGLSVAQAIARISTDPAVVVAEPNWIYTLGADPQLIPSDPNFGQLWGLHNTAQVVNGQTGGTVDADIDAPEAWAAKGTGAASVVVGVIDEGIDFNHQDLAGQIWINPVEAAGVAGVDDDGNGYVDDVRGWDFANGDNTVYDGNGKTSTDAHGTHVSGTIGARANNAAGVAGVNWSVTIVPAKFLGKNGGTTANAIKAVDYLTDLKARHDLHLVATNNSWGGGGFSRTLLEAIARGANAEILFMAAAGNGDRRGVGIDLDRYPQYPASYNTLDVLDATYDAVIAVAATGRSDELRPWSNYGATNVDLGAPGSLILSTVPGNKYAYYNGTSMATPHVTGVAALVNSALGLTGAALKAKILGGVDAAPSAWSGKVSSHGRLNARGAVAP